MRCLKMQVEKVDFICHSSIRKVINISTYMGLTRAMWTIFMPMEFTYYIKYINRGANANFAPV